MKRTVTIREADYSNAERVIADALDKSNLKLKGATVLVKPNILSAKPPEMGVTTHPAVVRGIVKFLLEKGAKPVVGDNPGVSGYGKSGIAAKKSGIEKASLGFYKNISDDTIEVQVNSRFFKKLFVPRIFLDADLVISVPKLKTHSLTIITGAVKNMFGMLIGGEKSMVHATAKTPEKFAEALIDIYEIRTPELAIMDGIEGMEGNGPTSGPVRKIGKLLFSTNSVSLDAVMAEMINIPAGHIPYLRIASERGLGEIKISSITIDGNMEVIKDFKKPVNYILPGISGLGAYFVNRFVFQRFAVNQLHLKRALCNKCKICVKHCPTGAMNMNSRDEGFPHIDKSVCITCYCCHELCPENAWEIKGVTGLVQQMRR